MCKLYYYVQTTCYTASVAILTVICLERYIAIIYPMHTRRLHDIRLLVPVVVCAWIIAAVSGIHYLVIFDTRQVPAAGGALVQFCVTVHDFNARLYSIISFIMWYAGPLAVMTIVYIRISIVLWRSSTINRSSAVAGGSGHAMFTVQTRCSASNELEMAAVRQSDPGSVDRDEICSVTPQMHGSQCIPTTPVRGPSGDSTRLTDNAAVISGRRRVIRLLVVVVATFAVCVLPYHVRVIWQTFAEPHFVDDWHLLIPPLTFVVYYINSAANPLLYAFLSDRFRSSLADVLRGRCGRRSQTALATRPPRTLRTTPI